MRVAEDLIVSFFCKATGYPQPTFHWEKKGKKLTNRKLLRYQVISMPNGSVLRIEPIKKRKDSHTFTCLATNEHGEARASAELSIFTVEGKTYTCIYVLRKVRIWTIPESLCAK